MLFRSRVGQRMLFSATLDNGVNVLVKKFLTDPRTHEADSAQSPVSQMDHHVLHVSRDQRVPVLVDLTSAPGRTVVFTRTKHGAKALSRQLNKMGVPTVELHGNLSQNARTRNMDAFHAGEASTLVATDIAARGIHVDDVALVVHADPPAEHKAYLHRSGRTARAGASGTVITLMTEEQVRDVRDLTRAAGIKPTITKVDGPRHPVLAQLAPGERVLVAGGLPGSSTEPVPARSGGSRPGGGGGGRGRRSGGGSAGGSSTGGQARQGGGGQGGQGRRGGQGAGGAASKPAGAGGGRNRRSGGRGGCIRLTRECKQAGNGGRRIGGGLGAGNSCGFCLGALFFGLCLGVGFGNALCLFLVDLLDCLEKLCVPA